jgi:hypothetical protein
MTEVFTIGNEMVFTNIREFLSFLKEVKCLGMLDIIVHGIRQKVSIAHYNVIVGVFLSQKHK